MASLTSVLSSSRAGLGSVTYNDGNSGGKALMVVQVGAVMTAQTSGNGRFFFPGLWGSLHPALVGLLAVGRLAVRNEPTTRRRVFLWLSR